MKTKKIITMSTAVMFLIGTLSIGTYAQGDKNGISMQKWLQMRNSTQQQQRPEQNFGGQQGMRQGKGQKQQIPEMWKKFQEQRGKFEDKKQQGKTDFKDWKAIVEATKAEADKIKAEIKVLREQMQADTKDLKSQLIDAQIAALTAVKNGESEDAIKAKWAVVKDLKAQIDTATADVRAQIEVKERLLGVLIPKRWGTNDKPKPSAKPSPTAVPSAEPTAEPTATPAPSAEPTSTPTPTVEPTAAPTAEPTAVPTEEPTAEPTPEPTAVPQ